MGLRMGWVGTALDWFGGCLEDVGGLGAWNWFLGLVVVKLGLVGGSVVVCCWWIGVVVLKFVRPCSTQAPQLETFGLVFRFAH